eukprot:s577_g4.t1
MQLRVFLNQVRHLSLPVMEHLHDWNCVRFLVQNAAAHDCCGNGTMEALAPMIFDACLGYFQVAKPCSALSWSLLFQEITRRTSQGLKGQRTATRQTGSLESSMT